MSSPVLMIGELLTTADALAFKVPEQRRVLRRETFWPSPQQALHFGLTEVRRRHTAIFGGFRGSGLDPCLRNRDLDQHHAIPKVSGFGIDRLATELTWVVP